MSYPRFQLSRSIDYATKSSANTTCNSAAWTSFDSTLDLSIPVQESDVIEVGLNAKAGNEAVQIYFDVALMTSGAPVNWVGSSALNVANAGVPSWWGIASAESHIGGSVFYTIQSADIESNTTTLRLYYRTSAASNKTIYSSTASGIFSWHVKNLGPITSV